MIILKVTKNQGFTFSLDDTFFEKPKGGAGGRGVNLTPSRFRVKQPISEPSEDQMELVLSVAILIKKLKTYLHG